MNEADRLKLATEIALQSGFIKHYFHLLRFVSKDEAAYELAEADYFTLFKRRRYRSWASFKVVKNRTLVSER